MNIHWIHKKKTMQFIYEYLLKKTTIKKNKSKKEQNEQKKHTKK